MSARLADEPNPETPVPATAAVLIGQTDQHLCSATDASRLGVSVHREVVEPFLRLQAEARDAGFDLQVLSGFRSFDHQRSIWNRKATGSLPVLDSDARVMDIETMSPDQLVFAILRWSALPGASRHHWGTDLDVYDGAALPADYEIELIPEEVNPGGMFGPLHEWLDARIDGGTAFGFFRPYDRDRGGVAPERWHLSFAPVATTYTPHLTSALLRDTIERADLELADAVLSNLDEIYRRFVTNTNSPA